MCGTQGGGSAGAGPALIDARPQQHGDDVGEWPAISFGMGKGRTGQRQW